MTTLKLEFVGEIGKLVDRILDDQMDWDPRVDIPDDIRMSLTDHVVAEIEARLDEYSAHRAELEEMVAGQHEQPEPLQRYEDKHGT